MYGLMKIDSRLVSSGCRICWLHLCREDTSNECLEFDTKLSHGETQVLELCGMCNTPSLSLLQGPLWPGVVVPVSVSSMGKKELFNHLTVYQ